MEDQSNRTQPIWKDRKDETQRIKVKQKLRSQQRKKKKNPWKPRKAEILECPKIERNQDEHKVKQNSK